MEEAVKLKILACLSAAKHTQGFKTERSSGGGGCILFIPTSPPLTGTTLTSITYHTSAERVVRGALMHDVSIAKPSANGNTPYHQNSV